MNDLEKLAAARQQAWQTYPTRPARSSSGWFYAFIALLALAVIGLGALVVLFVLYRGGNSLMSAAGSTSTPAARPLIPRASLPLPVSSQAPPPNDGYTFFPKLEQLQGVECLWGGRHGLPVPVLGEAREIRLRPNTRCVIVKVIKSDPGEFSHPESEGYKLYVKAEDATVVVYPTLTSTTGGYMHTSMVPVVDYDRAVKLWQGKSFRFVGERIGKIEVAKGTPVVIENVDAYDYESEMGSIFEVTCRLPSGDKAKALIYTHSHPEWESLP